MSLTRVPGITVGHQSLGDTGCTVILAQGSAVASVDVRGGGPGTRETDLLAPHNTVERIHAITLTGGSAFGLASADGVMAELESRGIGFKVLDDKANSPIVPIVPAAVIFDLLVGDAAHRPTAADGAAAAAAALASPAGEPEQGSVGAGCGATAGVLRGGWGEASVSVGKYTVAAGIVANPVGSVINPRTGAMYGDDTITVDTEKFATLESPAAKLNTTIGVVATDAPITKAQAKRIAMTAHDGIAIAVRPAHSPLDGDTLFALSTGDGTGVDTETMTALSAAAATVVAQAIVGAVTHASPGYGLTALSEIK